MAELYAAVQEQRPDIISKSLSGTGFCLESGIYSTAV